MASMAPMTDIPQAPERVALHYTGSQSIRVAESAHPNPWLIDPGSVVVVDRWAADILTQGDAFKQAAGAVLDDALKAAGLPASGTADERRDRLATHEQELAAARAAEVAEQTPTTPDEQETDDRG